MPWGWFLVALALGAETKPKYGPDTTRLFSSHEYLRRSEAPDFWALIPYYVPQRDPGACALSVVTMLVNASRARRDLGAADKLATQAEVAKRVDIRRHGTEKGIRGVSLPGFERILRRALDAYGLKGYELERRLVENTSEETRERIHGLLSSNEASDKDFLVPLFLQADFTGDPEGVAGHFAPVAAYDRDKRRVLLLDPDREWYEPYWVPLATFVKGMANPKADSIRPGGYVRLKWIRR